MGDVHRGISHGRDVSDVGRGLRAVVWERFAGQVVQVVLTVAVLLALPSPVHSSMPLVAVASSWRSLVRRGSPRSVAWARPAQLPASRRGASVAGHRARVCAGRLRPRGHVPDRRADRGRHRAAVPAAAAGAARDAGHGAAQRRWLGAARGRDGMGVRRGRPGRAARASRPPSSTASWCSSPACRAPPSSWCHGSSCRLRTDDRRSGGAAHA